MSITDAPTSVDSIFPEVNGLVYDESEMALFHTKLSYHSTIDHRIASQDASLMSISENQASMIKRWDMLMQIERDMSNMGRKLPPTDQKQLA